MLTERIKELLFASLLAVVGVSPVLAMFVFPHAFTWVNLLLAILCLVACLTASILTIRKAYEEDNFDKLVSSLGVSKGSLDRDQLLEKLTVELRRKDRLLKLNLLDQKLQSSDDLSKALDRIVSLAMELLNAVSVELALYDSDTAMYHSALCVGLPFDSSAQAMLARAVEGDRLEIPKEIMVQKISFAGSELGSLRVALKKGSRPNQIQAEVLSNIALQAGLAILNAEYSQELMRLKQQSEESIKAKTGFLANLSHELRGPLGIMLNAVELVHDGLCGDLNEDQLETLAMVKGNGQHLLELVNDVLDYAKVESGTLLPEFEDVQLSSLLTTIYAIVRGQAEMKSQTFEIDVPEPTLGIEVDSRHIRQMLINLLTNAIKYTKDGGSIKLWAERSSTGNVNISVKDSGVGIPQSEQHKVFAAFERVEDQYSKKQVGTGLGMPLTKRLAEANGGQINFTSEESVGSHFWLSFPAIEVQENQQAAAEKDTGPEKIGEGRLILLMETNPQERNVLTRYLRHRGFEIVKADIVTEALEVVRTRDISVVLIDNRILEQTTEEVVHSLRSSAGNPQLPLILLSSRAFSFDIEYYLRSGIDICLSKPLDLAELAYTCHQSIEKPQSHLDSSTATI